MDYETLESDYDSSGGDEEFRVYLYPNTPSMDDNCEGEVCDGLMKLVDQIFPDIAWSYEILISYEHPDIPGDDFNTKYDNWTTFSEGRTDDDVGVHMLYYQKPTDTSRGRTQKPSSHPADKGAWDDSYDLMIGRYWDTPVAAIHNLAAHEVMHAFINQHEPHVADMRDDDEEHDLGTVYSGVFGDGPVTPMATGYADTHGRHGDCATDAPWNKTYDHNLTDCTYDALYYTSDNHE